MIRDRLVFSGGWRRDRARLLEQLRSTARTDPLTGLANRRAWDAHLRPTDTLARYGGEEFALLLPHCDTATAESIVARLLSAVPDGQTASCGIAEWDGEESAEALTARADAALYMAKRGGRARAVLV